MSGVGSGFRFKVLVLGKGFRKSETLPTICEDKTEPDVCLEKRLL